jgi:cofilin
MLEKIGSNCPIDHFILSMTTVIAIKVGEDCVTAWNDVKIGHKYRYVIFTFSDDLARVLVEKKADPSKTYEDFLTNIPQHDVRYAVFDFDFKVDDGTNRNKLIFVVWAPDTAPVKKKMVIASAKSSVKNIFTGVGVEIQATDDSEIAHSTVLSKVVASVH